MNSSFDPIVVEVIVFAIVVALVICVASLKSRNTEVIHARVRDLCGTQEKAPPRTRSFQSLTQSLPAVTNALLTNDSERQLQIGKRLIEAGIYQPWASSCYVLAQVVLPILLGGIGGLIAHYFALPWDRALLMIGPAALVGICLPYLWLSRECETRRAKIHRAIPDFLDIVVACLGGGMSIQAALRQVADEIKIAHPILANELAILLREIELGCTLDQSLQQLAVRTNVDELKTLRLFIHQSSKFGTTITDALTEMAEMLRIQREQRAEERAQKAAVKILFPTVVFIFPTLFVILAGPAALQIKHSFKNSMSGQSTAK